MDGAAPCMKILVYFKRREIYLNNDHPKIESNVGAGGSTILVTGLIGDEDKSCSTCLYADKLTMQKLTDYLVSASARSV